MDHRYPSKLAALLSEGALVADRLDAAKTICDDWITHGKGDMLPVLAVRAVVRQLVLWEWDDRQGVATEEYERFVTMMKPSLQRAVSLLVDSSPADVVNKALEDMAQSFALFMR